MELFAQFVALKWYLFLALGGMVFMLLAHERRKSGPAVSPAQLTALVNQESAHVIDVRDPAEFRQGHIVGSLNVPFAKLAERYAEVERMRNEPVVVVCKLGHQAGVITRTLKEKGFERVYRLQGGIMEWQGSQLPLVRS